MFIRAGKIVLDAPMDAIGERFVEVLVNADQLENARALGPIDERALPFGKTMMLFDGLPQSQLAPLGETRPPGLRSEEHKSELQSLMRLSYAVFCLKKKKRKT